MAPEGDEGRGKLRKAACSCKQAIKRRCPNGETRHIEDMSLYTEYIGI